MSKQFFESLGVLGHSHHQHMGSVRGASQRKLGRVTGSKELQMMHYHINIVL